MAYKVQTTNEVKSYFLGFDEAKTFFLRSFLYFKLLFLHIRTNALTIAFLSHNQSHCAMQENEQNQLNIELPEDVAEGTYSNMVIIAHSHSDFVLDFVRIVPGAPRAKVKSRIILTPEHAKRLMKALQDNVEKYETAFGRIQIHNEPSVYPMNFGSTMGEA